MLDSPHQKVIAWARDVGQNRSKLMAEVERVETLLEGVLEPDGGPGSDLSSRLIEALRTYVDGILGVIKANAESLRLLTDSEASLARLEEELAYRKLDEVVAALM